LSGPFVLDASMTLSWAFQSESSPLTDTILNSLASVHAVVPALWAFEVVSGLCTAERRGRMDVAAQAAFVERLRLLPIVVEHRPAAWLAQQVLPLARKYRISAYDAAYLDMALREKLPLATLDVDLGRAATAAGVALVAAV